MELEDLKEIVLSFPQAVKRHIETHFQPTPRTDYVGWLQIMGEDVIYRVWAYKTTKKYGTQQREVIRSILGKPYVIYRDMYLSYAGGYKVVFRASQSTSVSWYGYQYYSYGEEDFGKWMEEKKIGVAVDIINLDVLNNTKFKYSGYSGNGDFLEWMRTFVEYPQVEYLGKLGFPPSRKLLKKAAKDKAFCKYLARANPNGNINAIIYAYDHNISTLEAGDILCKKQDAGKKFKGNEWLKKAKIDTIKAMRYIDRVGCTPQSYCDYVEACVGLKLDMSDTKNAFPDDYRRMECIRINQWDSKRNKQKNKEFKEAALKYQKYEIHGEIYSIIIPQRLADLKTEGIMLDHCVGKMGYDQKMIKGESFIAFVRKNDNLNNPFVTVEYGLSSKRVLQCYGYRDSNPEKPVTDFVKKWEKACKKLQGA